MCGYEPVLIVSPWQSCVVGPVADSQRLVAHRDAGQAEDSLDPGPRTERHGRDVPDLRGADLRERPVRALRQLRVRPARPRLRSAGAAVRGPRIRRRVPARVLQRAALIRR